MPAKPIRLFCLLFLMVSGMARAETGPRVSDRDYRPQADILFPDEQDGDEDASKKPARIFWDVLKIGGGALLGIGGFAANALADIPACDENEIIIGPCRRGGKGDADENRAQGGALMGVGAGLILWGIVDLGLMGSEPD